MVGIELNWLVALNWHGGYRLNWFGYVIRRIRDRIGFDKTN